MSARCRRPAPPRRGGVGVRIGVGHQANSHRSPAQFADTVVPGLPDSGRRRQPWRYGSQLTTRLGRGNCPRKDSNVLIQFEETDSRSPCQGTGRWEFHPLSWFSQTPPPRGPCKHGDRTPYPYVPGLSVVDQALSYLMETGLMAHWNRKSYARKATRSCSPVAVWSPTANGPSAALTQRRKATNW